jgi:Zn ribbon nucleic-acid-binding protein
VNESVVLPPDQGMRHMPQPHMRPDPTLIPIERPRCPSCQNRMMLAFIMPGPAGYDVRNFECVKCNHVETRMICSDPMKAGPVGWTNSDLNPPK